MGGVNIDPLIVDEDALSFVGTLPFRQSWYSGGFSTHDTPACPELSFGARLWVPLFTARFPRMEDQRCGFATFARLKGSKTAIVAFLPGPAFFAKAEISLLLGLLPLCQQTRKMLNMLLVQSKSAIDKPGNASLTGMAETLTTSSSVVGSILVPGSNEPLALVASQFETGQPRAHEATSVQVFPYMQSCIEWAERRDLQQQKVSEDNFLPTRDSSRAQMREFRKNLDMLNKESSILDPFCADELVGWRYVAIDMAPESPRGSAFGGVRFADFDDYEGAPVDKTARNRTSLAHFDTSDMLEAISEDCEEQEDENLVISFRRSRSRKSVSGAPRNRFAFDFDGDGFCSSKRKPPSKYFAGTANMLQ